MDVNVEFANNPQRLSAEMELHEVVRKIQTCVKSGGSAEYYLTVLPRWLKQLETAYENFTITEAAVEAELSGKTRYHG